MYGSEDRKLFQRAVTALESIDKNVKVFVQVAQSTQKAIEDLDEKVGQVLEILKAEEAQGNPVALKFTLGTPVNK